MTALHLFLSVWNGDPADVETAWFRAEQSAHAHNNKRIAKHCRIAQRRCRPVTKTTSHYVTPSGRLVEVTERVNY